MKTIKTDNQKITIVMTRTCDELHLDFDYGDGNTQTVKLPVEYCKEKFLQSGFAKNIINFIVKD